MSRNTFWNAFPLAPVVGRPGTMTGGIGVVPGSVATAVPLHAAPVIVLKPKIEEHPARNEIATGPPLHGKPVVMLNPRAVVQPGNGPTVAVAVPLQAKPVVTLYPRAEEQPAGKVAT